MMNACLASAAPAGIGALRAPRRGAPSSPGPSRGGAVLASNGAQRLGACSGPPSLVRRSLPSQLRPFPRVHGIMAARLTVRASNAPPPPPPRKKDFSKNAKLRGEALAPFRTFRIFLYGGLAASAALGTLITLTKLIGIVGNAPGADPLPDTLQNLGIDVAALAILVFLLSRDNKARNAQLERISREETLGVLQVELSTGRVVPVQRLQGFCRPVIVAGPIEFVENAMKEAEEFKPALMERGVMVMPLVRGPTNTDYLTEYKAKVMANAAAYEEEEDQEKERRWLGTPVRTLEWETWLDQQMSQAKVADGSGVYLSLRMDGRVRGSGTKRVPWAVLAAQLPPVKGLWKGFGSGFDGSARIE